MTHDHTKTKIDAKYILVFGIAVFSTWILHELAHWAVGECLGYKMAMSLNSGHSISEQYVNNLDYQIISAAGPVFTMLEAILIFILMNQRMRLMLYPFLFTCFYMRLFATVISIRRPNDEARISSAMGIGKFTLPIIVTGILLLLVYQISRKYRFDAKFNLANLGLVILFSSMIILLDMYFKIRLL